MKTLELQRQNHNIDWSLLCAHDDSPNRTFNILLVVMETPRWITWVKNCFFSLFYYYLISTVFGVYISVGRMIKKKNKIKIMDVIYYIYIYSLSKQKSRRLVHHQRTGCINIYNVSRSGFSNPLSGSLCICARAHK